MNKQPPKKKITNEFDALSASEKRAQSQITFRGGTVQYRNFVRCTLRDSFTQKEFRIIGKAVVVIGPVEGGNRGVYYRAYDGRGNTIIGIDPKQAEEDDIVHEFVHALKANDTSRTGYSATSHKRKGKGFDSRFAEKHAEDLSNAEEATVVAEATIRTKKPARTASGYYDEVPGIGKNKKKMKAAYDEDRLVLLNVPKGTKVENTKGVQGKAAVDKLNKNFERTNISKKKPGKRTALQSFKFIESIRKK